MKLTELLVALNFDQHTHETPTFLYYIPIMEQWQCCRTCLAVLNLNPIFQMQEHHEKYTQVILDATGVKIHLNDSLPQQMCTTCINSTNDAYNFRKKCQETQKSLSEQINNLNCEVKIEGVILNTKQLYSIDISNLIDADFPDSTSNYNLDLDENSSQYISSQVTSSQAVSSPVISSQDVEKPVKNCHKISKSKEMNKSLKRTKRSRKIGKEKKESEKVEIECEYCHKILTSKLSLRNHYKIHTGFDVVCEHCGKKFITRRLLLMHCKAKHGYEKTDKCSFCDYRASNAEQVKIHERLHTGEKPYICAECGVGFHRKSSYLQHVAIHLPEKTVQCTQCPARFKSVTLMRIHANRHRATQYTYKCVVCAHSFARRRNVARHLLRIHDMQPSPEHIERNKCA